MLSRTQRRLRIHRRIRKKVHGTAVRPRLSVFRSNAEIYAQAIDDEKGITLASFSSRQLKNVSGTKTQKAAEVGKTIGRMLLEKGIQQIVFDRGGYLYHGRIKALAEGIRESGVQF
ncbi:MAG: 50S ribosomal protein L18 [Chitinophagales bacterium]|nr:50S ribosomal protein L18 [Chitinophagales bacterium]MDW8394305.1 50S ribosomal protein L18 [Chitinophagales bacterium]